MPSMLCSSRIRYRQRQPKLYISKYRKPKMLSIRRRDFQHVKSSTISSIDLIKEFQEISLCQMERLNDETNGILYEDKYCRLRNDQLELKCYYFPTAQSKWILPSSIRVVRFETQDIPNALEYVKGWGMSTKFVWWACDISRCFHGETDNNHNVTLETGGRIMKGFTVCDIRAFLCALRPLLNADTRIVENFNANEHTIID